MSLFDTSVGDAGGPWLWNQYADAFSGQNDVPWAAFQPIAPPSAPTVAINATSGVLSGNYQYAVALGTGYWKGPIGSGTLIVGNNTGGGAASATVSPSAQQVNLSGIAIGPTGVAQRLLYRTKANGSTFYYLAALTDNTSTTYTDNIPDSSLGAPMPTTNTTGTIANLWKLNCTGSAVLQAGATLPSGTPSIALGVLSQQNSVLYLGNGTSAVPVGTNPLVNPLTYAF